MLREAQHLTEPGIRLVQSDARHIPIGDGYFDLGFMSMVYHHFSVPDGVLLEVRRTLRGNGVLCIRNSTRATLEQVLYVHFFPSALAYIRAKLPSHEELLATATRCGFVLRSHKIIDHVFADSGEEYLDKMGNELAPIFWLFLTTNFALGSKLWKLPSPVGPQMNQLRNQSTCLYLRSRPLGPNLTVNRTRRHMP